MFVMYHFGLRYRSKADPIISFGKEAKELGFKKKGNVIIQMILQNPIYAVMQYVKSFRELPGGLFPANHEAIKISDLGVLKNGGK